MPDRTPLAPELVDSRRRYLCRHIFTDGRRCASPAIRGRNFCYHHHAARAARPIAGRTGTFPMPRIDDRAAIQIALYDVLSRISAGDIDLKRANSLLYGLQIASSNLPRPAGAESPVLPAGAPLVEEITSDYHLGDLAPILELPPAELPLADAHLVFGHPAEEITAQPMPPPDTAVPSEDKTQNGCPGWLALGRPGEQAALQPDDPIAGEAELPDLPPVPIPPSCFAGSPQIISPEEAISAEQIDSAVHSAIRRTQAAPLEGDPASLPPSAPAP